MGIYHKIKRDIFCILPKCYGPPIDIQWYWIKRRNDDSLDIVWQSWVVAS